MPTSLMLLTNPFRPDPRVYREAKTLIHHGYGVVLLAWDREGTLPPEANEYGIQVTRLGPRCLYRSIGKIVSRLPRFWAKALMASRRFTFDVVHCNDFDTLPLGILIGRLRGKPVLYDAHDIYSFMISKDIGGLSELVWKMESRFSMKADEVITTSEAFAEKLSGGRSAPVKLVRNSPDTGAIEGADVKEIRQRYDLKGFVTSYLGSLEPGRFVNELMASFDPKGKAVLAIGGNGTLRPTVEEASKENPAIRFVGTVDNDEALRITLASDLVIAMLDSSNPNYRSSTPVKVLDAMACGRPMVVSEGLEISKVVAKVGCGFVVPYDRDAFKAVLERAQSPSIDLDAMGRKGLEHFEKELSWEQSQDELVKAYKALVRQN
jgi:glycosyltransferase involved in cell wall biosynthesis